MRPRVLSRVVRLFITHMNIRRSSATTNRTFHFPPAASTSAPLGGDDVVAGCLGSVFACDTGLGGNREATRPVGRLCQCRLGRRRLPHYTQLNVLKWNCQEPARGHRGAQSTCRELLMEGKRVPVRCCDLTREGAPWRERHR